MEVDSNSTEESSQFQCWICLAFVETDSTDVLKGVCKCKGTQQFVHADCLVIKYIF